MQVLGYSNNDSTIVFDVGGLAANDVVFALATAMKVHPLIAMWRVEPEVEEDDEDEAVTAEPDARNWTLYRVPLDENGPRFDDARVASHDDFRRCGYASTDRITEAVRILMQPRAMADEVKP